MYINIKNTLNILDHKDCFYVIVLNINSIFKIMVDCRERKAKI